MTAPINARDSLLWRLFLMVRNNTPSTAQNTAAQAAWAQDFHALQAEPATHDPKPHPQAAAPADEHEHDDPPHEEIEHELEAPAPEDPPEPKHKRKKHK
jgi:hypothetical protein